MIKDVVVPHTRIKKNKYLRGVEVPQWEYVGISPTYTKVDGTVIFKAVVSYKDVFGKFKVVHLGHFEDQLEAAHFRDQYIRDNNINAKLNFDELGNRINDRFKLGKDARRVISSLYGILNAEELAEVLGVSTLLVNKFVKDSNIEPRISRSYVVIVDNRDKYQESKDD